METERMILSTPSNEDRQDILKLKINEQTRKHLGGPVHERDLEGKFEEILQAIKPEQYWVIKEKESKTFVGLASITKYHDGIHYEISYELLPAFWDKGYGTEVMKKVLDYGFNTMQFNELYAETQTKNAASVRLLQKIGMKQVDIIHRFGEEQVVYALYNPL